MSDAVRAYPRPRPHPFAKRPPAFIAVNSVSLALKAGGSAGALGQ